MKLMCHNANSISEETIDPQKFAHLDFPFVEQKLMIFSRNVNVIKENVYLELISPYIAQVTIY